MTKALPPTVSHHGTKPKKQRRLCIGLCPAACQCWQDAITRCINRPVRNLAFPSTHSVTTISWIRGNGKAPSIPPQAGPMTVHPRTEQVKAKAVANTSFGRGTRGIPQTERQLCIPKCSPPCHRTVSDYITLTQHEAAAGHSCTGEHTPRHSVLCNAKCLLAAGCKEGEPWLPRTATSVTTLR